MITLGTALILLVLLQFKHFIIDWCWQPEYEWKNKGTYGHPGGVRHAIKNAAGTALCFAIITASLPISLLVFVLDGLAHYHMDWVKMNLNKLLLLTPATPGFYVMIGLDQAFHQLTYLFLIWMFLL
jgi:hypothetical protein